MQASRLGDFFHNRWVRLVIILDIIILAVIIAVIIYNVTKTAVIVFDIAPVDATISLNGDSSYTNDTYEVHPGTYEVTISHPDLDTKVFSVNLEPHATTKVITFLSASGNFDFYEYEDHLDSYEKLASIASASDNQTTDHDTSAEGFLAEQAVKNRVSSVLPVSFPICDGPATRTNCDSVILDYEYSEGCGWKKCIVIQARGDEFTDEYLSIAETYLSEKGYNLGDYQYTYKQEL